jgi:hypothetical protein
VLYAVVVAPKVALDVYKAILKVWPPEALKLCTASRISFLKDVHIVCVIAMIKISPYSVAFLA